MTIYIHSTLMKRLKHKEKLFSDLVRRTVRPFVGHSFKIHNFYNIGTFTFVHKRAAIKHQAQGFLFSPHALKT